jgi:hypothetical protein
VARRPVVLVTGASGAMGHSPFRRAGNRQSSRLIGGLPSLQGCNARIKRFALLPAPLTEAAGAGILFSRRVVDRQRVPDNACSSCSSSPS